MKQRKKQKPYQEKFDSEDGMSVGELSHHIGKKMTERYRNLKKILNENQNTKKGITMMIGILIIIKLIYTYI